MSAKLMRNRPGKGLGKGLGTGAERQGPAMIALGDIGTLLGMAVLLPLAWILPRRLWPGLCSGLAPVIGRFEGTGGEALPARIARYLGERKTTMPLPRIAARARAGFMEEFLGILRALRPWANTPNCTLHGGAHVTQALKEGRGVVLWVDEFHFYSLASKVALAEAGFRTVHLSHPTHGFSKTRFGMAVLNPVKIHVENRWLKDRVMMSFGGATGALRALQRHLRAGDVVSVTAGADAATPIELPFLGGTIRLAPGAPELAHMAKAPLLPVHTIYREDGTFEVSVEPPIEAPREDGRAAFAEAAAREYAERLAPVVLSYPHQWRGWFRM
jgi:lauroyl/myristoyl acyltransferase